MKQEPHSFSYDEAETLRHKNMGMVCEDTLLRNRCIETDIYHVICVVGLSLTSWTS